MMTTLRCLKDLKKARITRQDQWGPAQDDVAPRTISVHNTVPTKIELDTSDDSEKAESFLEDMVHADTT